MPEAGLFARGEVSAYSPVNGSDGVSVQDLAGNISITANRGRLSIELARVTLAPGARLAPHPVTGLEIVVVESGTVAASVTKRAVSAWVRDPRGHSVFADSWAQTYGGVQPGGREAAPTPAYANETAQAVTLLLLTVTPG